MKEDPHISFLEFVKEGQNNFEEKDSYHKKEKKNTDVL